MPARTMITRRIQLSAVLLCLLLSHCDLVEPSGDETSKGYSFAIYDATGALAVVGLFQIEPETDDAAEAVELTGSWEVTTRHESTVPVYLGDHGQLAGTLHRDGSFYLDMHPGFIDHNLILSGAFSDRPWGPIKGRWTWITIVGPSEGGTFDAVRR